MKKKQKVKREPPKGIEWHRLVRPRRQFASIRELAVTLIELVHYTDADGRAIGYTYDDILAAIRRKFPTVTTPGPWFGKPTRITYKELQNITGDLNREQRRLPFRPRRKTKKN
jgi:hypothetical protein